MTRTPLLLIFLTAMSLLSCVQQQQASNNFCTNLNATIDVKPRTDLSLAFGNDAIRTAIEAIQRQVISQPNSPKESLVDAGMNAGIQKAESNGKPVNTRDRSSLETYLRESVVPAVIQNPTCIFNVSASVKPYVGLEKAFIASVGTDHIVKIELRNTGQAEADPTVVIRNILNSKEYSRASGKIVLGPGQSRELSYPKAKLPYDDIVDGKQILDVDLEIYYLEGTSNALTHHREILHFNSADKAFSIVSP